MMRGCKEQRENSGRPSPQPSPAGRGSRRSCQRSLFGAGILALLVACATTVANSSGGKGVFRDITKASGVHFRIGSDMRRLKLIPTMIGGCAFGDYDGDGLPDLYVTNSIPHWGKKNERSCGRLYRNLGGAHFEDVTARAGIHVCGLGMGAFWVDLDGDGSLDLYLTNVGANTVYSNRGDGTLEEGKDTGLEDPLFSVGAAFLDYDGDGRVDVVVTNYLDSTPEWEARQPQFELRVPEDYAGQPSHLYRNLGGRRFADVTQQAGLGMNPMDTKTLGVAALDYDGDGRPDLFFVNDRVSNRLFHNRGDGTFEETTVESGAGVLGERARAGMGIAVGDPAGDGRPSLFVTNFGGEPNSLYRNVEGALFEDAGESSRAAQIGLPFVRWGTHFADFDDDGWPDLYAVGGHLAPRIVRMVGHYKSGKAKYVEAGDPGFAQKTVLLRNLGSGRFEEWKETGDLEAIRMSGRGGGHRQRRRPRPLHRGPGRAFPPLRERGRESQELDPHRAARGRGWKDGAGDEGEGDRPRPFADEGVLCLPVLCLGHADRSPLRAGRCRARGGDQHLLARRPQSGVSRRARPEELPPPSGRSTGNAVATKKESRRLPKEKRSVPSCQRFRPTSTRWRSRPFVPPRLWPATRLFRGSLSIGP